MKLVIQRVRHASVTIDNNLYSSIKQGLLVLVGVTQGDDSDDVELLMSMEKFLQ